MVITLLISILGISQPVFSFINSARSDTEGCLRGGVYYAEGASVLSDERCKHCVCTDGEVVCTTLECRGARANCRPMGFIKGSCCPLKFECDNEISQRLQEIPFSNSEEKTFRNTHSAKTCISRGLKYFSGQSVPAFSPCQSSCACVDGSIACTQSACPPAPPAFLGCTKSEHSNQCCPAYSCSSVRNTNQTLGRCEHEGVSYKDGEVVSSSDPCTDCYCWDGEVVCAHQECPDPPANNCRPVTSSNETCCPQKYQCFNVSQEGSDTVETPITTEAPSENKESTTTNENLTSTDVVDVGIVTDAAVDVNEVSEHNNESNVVTVAAVDVNEVTENNNESDIVTAASVDVKEVTENINEVNTVTDAAENVNEVTENNNEVDVVTDAAVNEVSEEIHTTVVIEEGTEASVTNSDDFTTAEPIISEDSTNKGSAHLTTVSDEDEFTTLANTEDYTETITELEQTTSYYVDNESTTTSNIDETPTELTSSNSISIEVTTLASPTDDNDVDKELMTDEVTSSTSISIEETTFDSSTDVNDVDKELMTTESSSDDYTVTENDMVTETTTIAFGEMCSNNGNVYSDGDSVPQTSQCQESCQCRNGTVTCIEKACTPSPPAFLRCASVEVLDDSDECCPKYNCPSISPSPGSPGCMKEGIQYDEGEFVPSANLCTDCYCLYGEILCAFLECSPPVRDSCSPIYDDERACCPQYYECDMEEDVQTTTMYETAEEPEATTVFSLFRFRL